MIPPAITMVISVSIHGSTELWRSPYFRILMGNNKVEKSEYILPTCQMSELVNCLLMCGKSLPMFYLTFLSLLCSPLLLYKWPIGAVTDISNVTTGNSPQSANKQRLTKLVKNLPRDEDNSWPGQAWLVKHLLISSAARWPRIRHRLLSWMKIRQERISNECKIFVNI